MAQAIEQFVVDCSVIIKWKFAGEEHYSMAEELLLDWQTGATEVHAPDLLPSEIGSAFLRSLRRGRVTEAEATDGVKELIALPYVL